VSQFLTSFEQAVSSSPRKALSGKMAYAVVPAVLLLVASAAAFVAFGPVREATGVGQSQRQGGSAASSSSETGLTRNEETAGAAKPDSAARSPELTKLIQLRAYKIWIDLGRPSGKAGEAVKERNWMQAEKRVEMDVNARAFQLWERQGRPTGAEGEAAGRKNRHDAEVQLLNETEEEFRKAAIQ
jgi:hypothetical protein